MLSPLGPRLAAVARHVMIGQPMADIGTDHAYLPAALVASGHCPRAIAADVRPGPLAQAAATLEDAGEPLAVELRLGDGLQVLRAGEVATITLCGMGGPLITQLLAAAPAGVLASGTRVIAQPMQGEQILRRWLHERGWRFVHEELVMEEGRLYPLVVAEVAAISEEAPRPEEVPCSGEAWGDLDEWIGPLLRHSSDALLPDYLQEQIDRLERAMAGLKAARGEAGQLRREALAKQLAVLRESHAQAARTGRDRHGAYGS